MGVKRVGRLRQLALIGIGVMFGSAGALALSPALSIRQYLHSSWTEIEGKPFPAIYNLTQAADGYLWVGSGAGLLRFDGIRFSPGLPGGLKADFSISYGLAPSARGGFWIAAESGIIRVQAGGLKTYQVGAANRQIRGMVEDRRGDLWVLSGGRDQSSFQVLSPGDGSIRRIGPEQGLPTGDVSTMMMDGDNFWLGVENGLCLWRPGTPASCRAVAGTVSSISRDRPGSVFAASGRTIVHASAATLETVVPMLSDVSIVPNGLLVDRGGNLWVGTTGGVLRIQGGNIERFARKDGLSGDGVVVITEDHEGDVWVATNNGIDRFRNPRALHLTTLDGLSGDLGLIVLAAHDGSMWIGTAGNGVNHVVAGKVKAYSLADGFPGKTVSALYEDAAGRIWMGADIALAYFRDGHFKTVPANDGTALTRVVSIAGDAQGTVWAATQTRGLWRVRGDVAEPVAATTFKDLFRVLPARDGTLWAGSFAHGIVRISPHGETQTIGPEAGIGPGAPRAFYEDASGSLWVGAGSTLTRICNGKTTNWGLREGLPEGEIYGITGDRHGSLWIVTATAVRRASFAELDSVPDRLLQPVHFTSYDSRDGLRLVRGGMGSPRIAAATDGRIWISERDGVAIMDPELLRRNDIPPPISIEEMTLDGKPLDRRLAFRGRELRIAYTALSLTAPERIRFRYRLDPLVEGWRDADSRRDVTFVNLSPGSYRFQVIACNLDDVWNNQGASIEFRVQPYFYQTVLFKLLIAATVGLIGWLVYRLRLRQMRARFELVSQERARVTREIHDSLLQGFAGVVYQLYAVSRQFDSDPKGSKAKLDRALDQADESMREARQMLLDMRLPMLENSSLPEALQKEGEKATSETPTAFHLKTRGTVVPLVYGLQAGLFMIGREAIHNAVNHAKASRISVLLVYAEKEVRMTVEDDGVGFDLAAAGRKTGHLGVRSMGERAKQIGADFKIVTGRSEGGTKIEVAVRRAKVSGTKDG